VYFTSSINNPIKIAGQKKGYSRENSRILNSQSKIFKMRWEIVTILAFCKSGGDKKKYD
jgi:hypothetical protein